MRHPLITEKDLIGLLQLFFMITAIVFFALIIFDATPMESAVYGASIHVFPPEAWAIYFAVSHSLGAFGTFTERYLLSAIGSAASVLAYIALAVYTSSAQYGVIVVLFSVFAHAPLFTSISIYAFQRWYDGRE